jgi:hypothetical protein
MERGGLGVLSQNIAKRCKVVANMIKLAGDVGGECRPVFCNNSRVTMATLASIKLSPGTYIRVCLSPFRYPRAGEIDWAACIRGVTEDFVVVEASLQQAECMQMRMPNVRTSRGELIGGAGHCLGSEPLCLP